MSGLRRRLDDEQGFTLVELLVTISLSLTIVAIATGSVIQALQTQRRQVQQVAIQAEANKALERMTRELRAANPLLGTPAAPTAGQASVQVTRGSVRTTTTYALATTTPGRQRIEVTRLVEDLAASPVTATTSTSTLIDGLALPSGTALFTYHDDDGAPITTAPIDPAAVRSVTVRLVLALPETTAVLDLQNEVTLRNGAQ